MVGRLKDIANTSKIGNIFSPVDDTGMFRSAEDAIAREVVLHLALKVSSIHNA